MKAHKKKTARGGWTPQAVLPEPMAHGGDLCRDRCYYITKLMLLQEEAAS